MTTTGKWAFPREGACEAKDRPGLTKREYFAGQALAGAMANPANHAVNDDVIAELVVDTADALIAALAEG